MSMCANELWNDYVWAYDTSLGAMLELACHRQGSELLDRSDVYAKLNAIEMKRVGCLPGRK
jgi:hypothetical protein